MANLATLSTLRVIRTMHGDTCPAERHTPNGHSANPRARQKSSDRPKVDSRTQGPAAADTSHSGTTLDQSAARRHPVSWILIGRKSLHCTTQPPPPDNVSKNQPQPIRIRSTHTHFVGFVMSRLILTQVAISM